MKNLKYYSSIKKVLSHYVNMYICNAGIFLENMHLNLSPLGTNSARVVRANLQTC